MRRALSALAVLGVLIAPASATAGPQSSHTQVRAVKVFQVAGEVQVDVVVAHPDAKAGARTHEAVNTGTARITLRADDGTVLATHAARAPLPVRVPQARQVMQTYRFALDPTAGAQVASAGRANVAVVAESRLDPDGPGPADPATDRDTDTADVAVENVDGVPPISHYLDIYFTTSHYCEIENGYCTAHFDSRSLPGPFRNETGRLRTQTMRGRTSVWLATVKNQFLEGVMPSIASGRYEITKGLIVAWGTGRITSAPRDAGTPGQHGGPLAVKTERSGGYSYDWHVWGYVDAAVSA